MTPDGTWRWLQGFTRWIGTWCFFVGYRLRVHHQDRIPTSGPVVVVAMFRGPLSWILVRIGQLAVRRGEGGVALIAELDQIRGLGVLRPKGA